MRDFNIAFDNGGVRHNFARRWTNEIRDFDITLDNGVRHNFARSQELGDGVVFGRSQSENRSQRQSTALQRPIYLRPASLFVVNGLATMILDANHITDGRRHIGLRHVPLVEQNVFANQARDDQLFFRTTKTIVHGFIVVDRVTLLLGNVRPVDATGGKEGIMEMER
jgi:hypothetical protein